MGVLCSHIAMSEYDSEKIPGILKFTLNNGDIVTYKREDMRMPRKVSGNFNTLTEFVKPTYELDEKEDEMSFWGLKALWNRQLRDIERKYKHAHCEASRIFEREKAELEVYMKKRIKDHKQLWSNLQKAMWEDCRQVKRELHDKFRGLGEPSNRLAMMVRWLRETKSDGMLQAAVLLESYSNYIINERAKEEKWGAFLSYESETASACRSICDDLSKKHTTVWWDKTADSTGKRGMIDGVRSSSIFIIVVSKNYFIEPSCLFEYSIATVLGRPMMTVAVTSQEQKAQDIFIPDMFKHINVFDIEISQNYWDASITRLHKRMMQIIERYSLMGFQGACDIMLNAEEQKWLTEQLREAGWKIGTRLFASWEDGNNAISFHTKCNHLGATITVIKPMQMFGAREKLVFGGFNPKSWTSEKEYVESNSSWLFRLRNGIYKRINIKPEPESHCFAVYNEPGGGPSFGVKDIRINYKTEKYQCQRFSYEEGILSEYGNRYFKPLHIAVFQCIQEKDNRLRNQI